MFSFSSSTQCWVQGRAPERVAEELDAFSLLTLNVWFDDYAFDMRREATLGLIAAARPDFVVLEEVTQGFLDGLLASKYVRESFFVSRAVLPSGQRYDVLVLSRFAVRGLSVHPLISAMGRNVCAIELGGRVPLLVAGVHLESGRQRANARLLQIEQSKALFTSHPNVIWAGDFNSDAGSDEDRQIRAQGFIDAWSALRQEPGLTRDSTRNRMIALLGETKATRLDRIYSKGVFQPTAVELVGTEPVAEGVFPSDHFGLCASFVRR